MLREVTQKAKFQLLEHRLGYLMALGALDALWMLTASSAPDGAIGRHLTDAQLESLLKWPGERGALIAALREERWLDEIDGDGRLYVHDWHEHADYTVHRKIARARAFFANGAAPKLGSLDKPERTELQEWYAGNPRVTRKQPESSSRDRLQGQGQGQGQIAEEESAARSTAAPDSDQPESAEPDPVTVDHPLLRLLARMDGEKDEKALWLESELPVLEAEAAASGKPISTLTVRFYRSYLERPGTERQPKRRWRDEVGIRKMRAAIRAREEAKARDRPAEPTAEPEVDLSGFNITRLGGARGTV